MDWDGDFDVKEYHPKKRNKNAEMENAVPFPTATAWWTYGAFNRDWTPALDGGAMMSTSEILDFAQGSDSYI